MSQKKKEFEEMQRLTAEKSTNLERGFQNLLIENQQLGNKIRELQDMVYLIENNCRLRSPHKPEQSRTSPDQMKKKDSGMIEASDETQHMKSQLLDLPQENTPRENLQSHEPPQQQQPPISSVF